MYFDVYVFEYCAQIIMIIQVFSTMKIQQGNLLIMSFITQTTIIFFY